MCGIAGLIDLSHRLDKKDVVKRMMDSMTHRGPDASGIWVDGDVAFGHRRLAVIDLSAGGNQPKLDNSKQLIITFNGEIYNYKKLKAELNEYNFITHSDTEVILAAYNYWGFNCVKHLKGQFAFAIWDKNKNLLFIARDHMGEKPFYYHLKDSVFYFASEVRSLLASGHIERNLNKNAIVDYLKYQSVNGPQTIVDQIYSLPAASVGVFKDGEYNIQSYWHPEEVQELPKNTSYEDVVKNVGSLFSSAVEGQMQSDVPLGAFLSGGIDSSAIVAMMSQHSSQPVHTFNVSFDDHRFDESQYALEVAKKFKTNHTQIDLKPTLLLDQLPDILSRADVPSGDGPNTFIISQAVKKLGLTVALSGLGGDDLFAGYQGFLRFYKLQKHSWFWKIPSNYRRTLVSVMSKLNSGLNIKTKALFSLDDVSITNFYALSRQVFVENELQMLAPSLNNKVDFLKSNMQEWAEKVDHMPLLSKYGLAELKGYTQQVLLKDSDNMAMANSVEIRSPFFDHDLVSYALSVNDTMKYPHTPKKLLVDALGSLLPHDIVHRKKMGFSFPWDQWIRHELKSFADENISNLAKRNIFDSKNLMNYYQSYCKGNPAIIWSKIWVLISLEAWLKENKF